MSPLCILAADCEAPSKPAATKVENPSYQSNDVTLSWEAATDNNVTVTYKVCMSASESFSSPVCKDDIAGQAVNANEFIPAETAGEWFWRVEAKDEAGNRSDWSEAQSIEVDTTDPVVTLELDDDDIGGNQPLINVVGSAVDDNLSGYQLLIIGPDGEVVLTINSPDTLTFAWSATDPVRLPSGQYIMQLSAHDTSGRVGIISRTFAVDNSGPTVDIVDGRLIKSGSITPEVAVSDAHQEKLTYIWVADEDNPGIIDFDATVLMPKMTPTVEGTYIYYLTVTDDFGNSTTVEYTFGYKRVLETLPQPDPTNPVVAQTNDPAAPNFTPPTPRPVIVAARAADTEESDVLGSTVATILGGSDPSNDNAVVSATTGGWRIVGILWYWWLLMGALLAVIALIVRRVIITRKTITPVI